MKKFLPFLVSFLLIFSIILSGCSPKPSPTPTLTPSPTSTLTPSPTSTPINNNPAIKEPLHFNADPTARQWTPGGPVYVYGTYDVTPIIGPDGNKIYGSRETEWHVFSSTDLMNWTDHGKALSIEDNVADEDDQYEVKWGKYHAWAPDCHSKNGKYYFYFPVSNSISVEEAKAQGKDINDYMYTGVAVGDSPTGPFKDPIGKPLAKFHDPAVFKDKDGSYYLYGDTHVARLGDDMISLAEEEPRTIEFKGEGNLIGKINPDTGKITKFEAPFVFEKNGIYYWTCAQEFHTLIYYTGSTPYGPFTYGGKIMAKGTGDSNNHHSIIEYEGRWLIFYHRWITGQGARRAHIEYLNFNPDGTIQEVTRTTTGVTYPYPSN